MVLGRNKNTPYYEKTYILGGNFMGYITNMDETTYVLIPTWVLREEKNYIQRQLDILRTTGIKVYW